MDLAQRVSRLEAQWRWQRIGFLALATSFGLTWLVAANRNDVVDSVHTRALYIHDNDDNIRATFAATEDGGASMVMTSQDKKFRIILEANNEHALLDSRHETDPKKDPPNHVQLTASKRGGQVGTWTLGKQKN